MRSLLETIWNRERFPNKGFACKTKYLSSGFSSSFLNKVYSNCFRTVKSRPKNVIPQTAILKLTPFFQSQVPLTSTAHSSQRLQSKKSTFWGVGEIIGGLGKTWVAVSGGQVMSMVARNTHFAFICLIRQTHCKGPGFCNALQRLELSLNPSPQKKPQITHHTSIQSQTSRKLASSQETKTQGSTCLCVLCNKLPHLKEDNKREVYTLKFCPAL